MRIFEKSFTLKDMNIEFIKSEFEKLSLIIRTWNEGEDISAIERDIALDKLKNIYDTLRFGVTAETVRESPSAQTAADDRPMPAVPTATENEDETAETVLEEKEPETDTGEKDVEVEFIFAEEDEADEEGDVVTAVEPESAGDATDVTGDEPRGDGAAEMPPAESAPVTPEPEPEEESRRAEEQVLSEENDGAQQPAHRTLDSLFDADEIGSRPRTKHHRMMSIYNDVHPREEKVIDISKIFDDDETRTQPAPSHLQTESVGERNAAVARENPEPSAAESRQAESEPNQVTLGDAINRNAHTLADKLAKPSALAEEITHAKITSLREAIGINDKFLMIRDLFDGDDEAYGRAIDMLDGFDSLDDCMIYIVENYSWNPDSEGAKFIMQLLERKLS